jgi:hypothetical protein
VFTLDNLGALRDRIAAIASLPEIRLGQSNVGFFSPERVAMILRDWVKGEPLSVLASRYDLSKEADSEKKTSTFSQYLFSNLLGQASWGIGALEGICLAGVDASTWQDAAYVPSMIFFGVDRKEAIWLRMIGVPRIVANALGEKWAREAGQAPQTYRAIREWVGQLRDDAWQAAIPSNSRLRASDMRILW